MTKHIESDLQFWERIVKDYKIKKLSQLKMNHAIAVDNNLSQKSA